MERAYGVVSDFHKIPISKAKKLIKKVAELSDVLVLNGDLVGNRSPSYLPEILFAAVKTEIPIYALAGNHEESFAFEILSSVFKEEYSNFHNANKILWCEEEKIGFLAGSTLRPGFTNGGYYILPDKPTGEFDIFFWNTNPKDLVSKIENPEKAIIFSHTPPKFSFTPAVDFSEFVEMRTYFLKSRELVYDLGITSLKTARKSRIPLYKRDPSNEKMEETLKRKRVPAWRVGIVKKENRGDENLAKIFKESGVRRVISGHFHSSVWIAHDWQGNLVPEETFVRELFWNASYADELKAGILYARGEEVAFKNLHLNSHKLF